MLERWAILNSVLFCLEVACLTVLMRRRAFFNTVESNIVKKLRNMARFLIISRCNRAALFL
ncbi:MAG: hypothetical protein ACI92E_000520 [Oceanicoccus sp.]|jgi:hypothetical protein